MYLIWMKLVFTTTRKKNSSIEAVEITKKSYYTTVFSGSAKGEFIPPYVIIGIQQKSSDWLYVVLKCSRLNTSKTGWVGAQVFNDWFELTF